MIVRIPNRYPRRVRGGFQVQGIPRCFFVSNVCVGYQCMFSANFLVLESESGEDCAARMPRLFRSIVMMPS